MVDADTLVGRIVADRYLITEKLGQGGMGAVYLARQESLGRHVAVKVMRSQHVDDPVAVARFKREASIISQLSHPNIVTVHDFGATSDGMLFIVMEHLKGPTLRTVLRALGVMPWTRSVGIALDIAKGLAVAHRHGVIHRDLKLDNIILVDTGVAGDVVKILDFGIAKSLEHDEGPSLTVSHGSPGTPGYMSPELARGTTDDPRSDFYALGICWFELLVGERPWKNKSAMDIFMAQMTEPAPSVRARRPQLDIPEHIDALITRLLDRAPEDRPKDAGELLTLIAKIDEEIPTQPSGRFSSSTPQGIAAVPNTATTGASIRLPTGVAGMGGMPPLSSSMGVPPEFRAGPISTTAGGDFPDISADMPVTESSSNVQLPSLDHLTAPRPPPQSASDAPARRRGVPPSVLVGAVVGVLTAGALVVLPQLFSRPGAVAINDDGARGDEMSSVAAPDPVPAAGSPSPAPPSVGALASNPDASPAEAPSFGAAAVASSSPGARPLGAVGAATAAPPRVASPAVRSSSSSSSAASSPATSSVAASPSESALTGASSSGPSSSAASSSTASSSSAASSSSVASSSVASSSVASSSAAPASAAASPSSDMDLPTAQARAAMALSERRAKGLLLDDIPGGRAHADGMNKALAAGDASGAARHAAALSTAIERVKIDDAFIGAKRARLEATLRREGVKDATKRAVDRQLAISQQCFFSDDRACANRALNEVWRFTREGRGAPE